MVDVLHPAFMFLCFVPSGTDELDGVSGNQKKKSGREKPPDLDTVGVGWEWDLNT